MNNKGQTLIIFIILTPIIILLLTLVIDLGIVQKEKTRLYGITKSIINNVYDETLSENDYKYKIEELYRKNEVEYKELTIKFTNKKLNILLKNPSNSFFGKFIGIIEYDIEINLTGYIENGKLIIEKG